MMGQNVPVLQCCSVAVLQSCSVAVLQCCSVAELQSCRVCRGTIDSFSWNTVARTRGFVGPPAGEGPLHAETLHQNFSETIFQIFSVPNFLCSKISLKQFFKSSLFQNFSGKKFLRKNFWTIFYKSLVVRWRKSLED